MNSIILDFLRTAPPLYQKSDRAFWDDEHISKGMLAAHLDGSHDAASRKFTTIRQSAGWISARCRAAAGRRLLDLGCGAGLYAELLCDDGFAVTGVDLSRRSIAYARNRAKETGRSIEYCCQNYLDLDCADEFDAAILIYYDFGVLSPDDRGVLLEKIRRALKRGGILILDALNEPYRDAFAEFQTIGYENGGFWSPAPYAVIQKNRLYPETNNTLEQYLVITEKDCARYCIWNQIYTKDTLTKEISAHGFAPDGLFDDACGKPFTGQGEGLCGVFVKM